MRNTVSLLAMVGACAVGLTAPAFAQSQDYGQLMALGDAELESELTSRYEAGLAASLDESYRAANDPRYLWALETKVQCGIALGFMKSDTRDETSITNCARAFVLMNRASAPQAPAALPSPPPPPPQRNEQCNDAIAGMVFFDFDSAEVGSEAASTLNTVVQNISVCNWSSLSVVGHADQAGSDEYNLGLSRERADAVADMLRSRTGGSVRIETGAQGESNPRVPLPDGTRSPQNRRVEIAAE